MLYKSNPALGAREMQGVVVSDYMPCFQRHEIERNFAVPPVTCAAAPKYVFTSADPNGGGSSHMAMCSGYYDIEGNFVVSISVAFY
jgi:hypothetical protein